MDIFTATELAYKNGYSAATKWISVDKSKPAEGVKVLAHTKSGNYCVARYNARFNRWMSSGNVVVTHWMPIPELPNL